MNKDIMFIGGSHHRRLAYLDENCNGIGMPVIESYPYVVRDAGEISEQKNENYYRINLLISPPDGEPFHIDFFAHSDLSWEQAFHKLLSGL